MPVMTRAGAQAVFGRCCVTHSRILGLRSYVKSAGSITQADLDLHMGATFRAISVNGADQNRFYTASAKSSRRCLGNQGRFKQLVECFLQLDQIDLLRYLGGKVALERQRHSNAGT